MGKALSGTHQKGKNMGLIKAIGAGIGSVAGDEWKEYFYCDSLPSEILIKKAEHHIGKGSSNKKGSENIITKDSVLVVNEGQCMLLVDQGKIVEVAAEPGEFIYDASTEPTVFAGGFGAGLLESIKKVGHRFTFGGDTAHDQRVYYVNIKELPDNKYGTPNPVPFRVVDQNIGLDVDIAIKCFGSYTMKVDDPVLLYTHLAGNVTDSYPVSELSDQLLSEFLTALQPAFAKISEMGIRYSAVPAHTKELSDLLNQELSNTWGQNYGLTITAVGVSSMKASEEDEKMIKDLQKTAVLRNSNMAAASLTEAQASAMKAAASNESTGPMLAFAGMNMANMAGGMDATKLYEMGEQSGKQSNGAVAAQAMPQNGSWKCECGTDNTGCFCSNCGKEKPEDSVWFCPDCGTKNEGNFCTKCGHKHP